MCQASTFATMESAVAREGAQDDFMLFSDRKYLPRGVRSVHVIYALLAVSYLLIVVLFVTSATNGQKAAALENDNTAAALASMQSNVQVVSSKAEAIKSDYSADFAKLRSEVQSSADGQKTIRDQVTNMEAKITSLTSKMIDLETNLIKVPANACGNAQEAWKYYGGSCYLFVITKSNWMAGKHMCETKNATLAIITSEGEQNFIKDKTKDSRYWIGLTDQDKEHEWQWIDGTDYKSSIKFWKEGEPNDSLKNEDCAHVWIDGEWNDMHCTYECFSICEKKAILQ
ncbi:hepatic lectin-like isoform X1 [Ambystoma mexicanum]|uniref:hepatic lectin-like isoform X1 n=1 Tax=Ambystoma mexicanum TaxID=8296 RepID=UPI0037E7088F